MLTLVLATLMAGAGLTMAALAAWVAWRRESRLGWSLAAVLVSVAVWGLAYAVELTVDDVADKTVWGIVKYVGVQALAPAWLTFVLQYTGRGRFVTRRLLALLAVEPVVVLTLLVVPATHDLVRYYPETTSADELPVVQTGPVFWVVLVYNNLILVAATVLFVASMVRLARTYRRMAWLLLASAVLPWAANLLHNLQVGWFARMDLTPFAFIVAGGLLVWGLFHERLVDLAPLARGAVVDSMADGVFVLDAFGRIVDVNPAAAALASGRRSTLVGRHLEDVLPEAAGTGATGEMVLDDVPPGAGDRVFDVSRSTLTDDSGRTAGQLVVLGEVTQRVRDRERLQRVLSEKSRIAAQLQASMVPPRLPEVAGTELASRYEPAGDGSEVGGDFLDVFELDGSGPGGPSWAFVLGDVSGKGAAAATVSAATRYTLRAFARADRSPADTLAEVNRTLLGQVDVERHCTLVLGHLRPTEGGTLVVLALAGHHPPLVLRRDGRVEEVGSAGTALALLDSPELHDVALALEPGELLCAFTDGIVEARQDDEMFGTERLARVLVEHARLPVDELAARVSEAVRAFHGDELADDLALLLVRSA
ncbi:histidine kinase N-terminal 7TM domain-containing protein [Nocardioides solisilvae]|uniref:histidine kinase N-terminal 7TM domain-containing protein n=1 Tax=Nocardioides solisilvae TaxID=1542435 RepID=UPI000D740F59|nr:histidine kinase N-terminal 7TM domain-containing protein [Nocardioides solisilvae]